MPRKSRAQGSELCRWSLRVRVARELQFSGLMRVRCVQSFFFPSPARQWRGREAQQVLFDKWNMRPFCERFGHNVA